MKFILRSFILSSAVLFLAGCGIQVTTQTTRTVPAEIPSRQYSLQSVVWQQNAAEYRALCYQAFNTAHFRLDELLQDKSLQGKKLAIITDIDETVLDNSPYNASLILENREYTSETWNDWVNKEEALPVPGAKDFLNYAASKGVEIFYVSNRRDTEVLPTIANMKTVNFPFADEKHCLFKSSHSEKESRFDEIKKDYTVLLYMGDNLSDFSNRFTAPSTNERNTTADELKEQFGKRFIVLPNPMYGDWESKGIYQGKHNWNGMQRDSLQRSSLRGY